MPLIERLRSWLQHSLPAQVINRFIAADLATQAAALAFFTLLSLAPLVLILLWLSTLLYPAAQEQFFTELGHLAGPELESTARTIVNNAEQQPSLGSFAAILGTAAMLLGASVVFAQLQWALNRAFVADPTQLAGGIWAWIRKRLLSFGMTAGLGFMLVVSLVLQAGLQAIAGQFAGLRVLFDLTLSLGLYTAVFAAMYWWLPDRDVSARLSLLGGLWTAALFLVGRWLIGLYLGRAGVGNAYGPAGGLVVLLVWIYYCAMVFLFGAAITAVICERRAAKAGAGA